MLPKTWPQISRLDLGLNNNNIFIAHLQQIIPAKKYPHEIRLSCVVQQAYLGVGVGVML